MIEDTEDDEDVADDRGDDQARQEEDGEDCRPEGTFLTCCFSFIQPGIFMQKLLVNFRKSFYICCRKIFKKAFMQSVSISIKNNIFL